jgi:hypothetical protein
MIFIFAVFMPKFSNPCLFKKKNKRFYLKPFKIKKNFTQLKIPGNFFLVHSIKWLQRRKLAYRPWMMTDTN